MFQPVLTNSGLVTPLGVHHAMSVGLLNIKTPSQEPWGPLGPALVFQCLQGLTAHLLRFSFRCRSQPKMVIPASQSRVPVVYPVSNGAAERMGSGHGCAGKAAPSPARSPKWRRRFALESVSCAITSRGKISRSSST